MKAETLQIILAFFALLCLNVADDYVTIKKQVNVSHGLNVVIYGIIAMLMAAAFGDVAAVVLYPAMRWLFHDAVLNVVRGLHINYLGEAAKLDRLLTWLEERGVSQYFVKITLLLLSVWAYVSISL